MTEDELERQLRAWFRTRSEADALVLDSVRTRLRATLTSEPGRSRWSDRRRSVALLVAAAMVGSILIGSAVLVGADGLRPPGGPPALLPPATSTTPSHGPSGSVPPSIPITSPRPTARPSPTPPDDGSGADLLPDGTLVIGRPFPVALQMTVPDGWRITDDGPGLIQLSTVGDGSGRRLRTTLFFTIVRSLFADPCEAGQQHFGDTPEELAHALAELPRLAATGPDERQLDGYRALVVQLTAPDELGACPNGAWLLWPGPNDHWLVPAERNDIWIVDVDGLRLVISAEHFKDDPEAARVQVERMVKSIDILGKAD